MEYLHFNKLPCDIYDADVSKWLTKLSVTVNYWNSPFQILSKREVKF